MFSLEFGATKESGSRAFIDPDDDEDYEDIPEKWVNLGLVYRKPEDLLEATVRKSWYNNLTYLIKYMILFFRTFVDTYTLEKKSNSVVILTTTKMAQGELNAMKWSISFFRMGDFWIRFWE